MESDRRQAHKTRLHDGSIVGARRAKIGDNRGPTSIVATRLLWFPIATLLISGLTILVFPKLWQSFFHKLAATYPELSVGLARSMLAAGMFLLLAAGIYLFVMSAYQQRARWAWILFLLFATFGWGGWLFVVMKAGITLAAIFCAAVILSTWAGLGLSAGEFFGSIGGAPDFESF